MSKFDAKAIAERIVWIHDRLRSGKCPKDECAELADELFHSNFIVAKTYLTLASRAERMNAEIHRLRGRLSHYEAVGIWNDDKGTE